MALLITGYTREDGKVRVASVTRTEQVKKEHQDNPDVHVFENEMGVPPAPEYKRGKTHVQYYDPETKTFSYEEEDAPLSEQDKQDVMIELLEEIKELLKK